MAQALFAHEFDIALRHEGAPALAGFDETLGFEFCIRPLGGDHADAQIGRQRANAGKAGFPDAVRRS